MEKVILHITSGGGPAECERAAAKVLAILLEELRGYGAEIQVLHRVAGMENATIRMALLEVKHTEVKRLVPPWLGTVLWIEKSPYRPQHGRKNWYIGIFEQAEAPAFAFRETDVQIQAVRSSGAGGQHVNKVSSAVRLTHMPTGISVFAQDSRSQLRNKQLGMERLQEKVHRFRNQEQVDQAAQCYQQQLTLERSNPVKVFRGEVFTRKKEKKRFHKERAREKRAWQKNLE